MLAAYRQGFAAKLFPEIYESASVKSIVEKILAVLDSDLCDVKAPDLPLDLQLPFELSAFVRWCESDDAGVPQGLTSFAGLYHSQSAAAVFPALHEDTAQPRVVRILSELDRDATLEFSRWLTREEANALTAFVRWCESDDLEAAYEAYALI